MHPSYYRLSHRHQAVGGGLLTTARYAMHAPDFNHASAISPRRLQLFVARTFRQRLQGLHAYPKLSWHTGLCIRPCNAIHTFRSEEHTSELQSLMRISYAVFCLKKKKTKTQT